MNGTQYFTKHYRTLQRLQAIPLNTTNFFTIPYYTTSTTALTKWTQDIPNLTISTLLSALERGLKYLPSSRYLEMTLQICHMAHIAPVRGYKMGSLSTNRCFHCGVAEGTLFHYVWQCPLVQAFWHKVRLFTVTHLVNHVSFDPIWAIIGFIDPDDTPCTPGNVCT